MKSVKRLGKGKIALIVIAVILIVSVAAIVTISVLNYKSSLIPKMTSEEILQYTLKDNDRGLISVGIVNGESSSYTVYGKDGKVVDNALHTYEIGSLTKTVTASLVSKAVLDGVVDIDASLDKYLDLPAKSHYPTIKQLLTHTSGYKQYYIDGPMISSHFTKNNDFYGIGDSDILKRLAKENVVGKDYSYNYSNFGYATLGLVFEKVCKTEFTLLINNYLSQLGLKNTRISDGSGDLSGYWDWQNGDAYLSAGGLVSDVNDMLKYAQLQLKNENVFNNAHNPLKLFDANNASYSKLGIRIDGVAYGWVVDKENDILWHKDVV